MLDKLYSLNNYIIFNYNNIRLVSLQEHYGIEFIVRLNRILYEIKHIMIKNQKDRHIVLQSYNNNPFFADINKNNIIIETNLGLSYIKKEDIDLIRERINVFLTEKYGKNIIDFTSIDPMFLERVLGVDLPNIIDAKMERIKVSELRIFSLRSEKGVSIEEGRYYNQIVNNSYINYPNHYNNFIGQSNEERIKENLENMKNGSYGKNGSYIILYNDSNVIRDGEHRAAALLYLYGDIDISVMRLYFKKNHYSYRLYYKGENI